MNLSLRKLASDGVQLGGCGAASVALGVVPLAFPRRPRRSGGGELTRTSRGWEREELVSSKATSVGLNFGTW